MGDSVQPIRAVDPMTTADVLNRAADLIDTMGWFHFPSGMTPDASTLCAVEAISLAAPGPEYVVALDAFKDYLGTPNVMRWNDAYGRTADEVITALRAAAQAVIGTTGE